MPRKATSQWEFGELFERQETRRVWSVAELTRRVKGLLEHQFGTLWVTGEVSNCRAQSSGHVYFTLKDATAALSCVLFRSEAAGQRHLVEDGRRLTLRGALSVYEPRGQYQLVVNAVELEGLGALQQAFERLKQRLQAEGLFATERKRPMPRFPRRIGIVTSPDGAALQDVLQAFERRHRGLQLVLAGCRVQGAGAAAEIAAAVSGLNAWSRAHTPAHAADGQALDAILVTRGGGSLEDLWPFNEEVVARAVFESAVPVISAVGHEIDFTICDFVADLRAATPTAAAEILTEGYVAVRPWLAQVRAQMRQRTLERLGRVQERARELGQRLARRHPRRQLQERWQRLDEVSGWLRGNLRGRMREQTARWRTVHVRVGLAVPRQQVSRARERLQFVLKRRRDQALLRAQQKRGHYAQLEARMRLLSPAHTLARGYSITTDAATGRVLRRVSEVRSGQRLVTRLQDGAVSSIADPTPP
jgi:exodeoxyribonuclease VII large subunit